MSKMTAFPCTQTDCEYGILLPLVMNIIVGPTIVIKRFLLRHRLCLKIVLFLLHCSEKATFLLSFIYTCDIIWPPAPFESCYLARNLKEVARAWLRTISISPGPHALFLEITQVFQETSVMSVLWAQARGYTGLHNLFANGFNVGWHQMLTLLLLNICKKKKKLKKTLKKKVIFFFFKILKNRVGGSVNQVIQKKRPYVKPF